MYDFPIQFDHPYLLHQRHITYDVTTHFGVGGYNNHILFPVHDPHGTFVDYIPRVLDHTEPKYCLPTGFAKTQYLFNYHRAKEARRQAVIVVEGFFGCIWLHQLGYPSVVALMGSTMSEKQEHLLTRWWEYVIFMMDGDAPGRRAQKDFVERMNKRGLKGVFGVNVPDGTQPDHLSLAQIQTVLQLG